MGNDYFQFKQFTVHHDLCAMKVGTDGVLLGAWADCLDARRILDIGTGSGLIALMAAQRSQAFVDAVEIDEPAFRQAIRNTSCSPFSDRIRIIHSDIRHYQTDLKYDLVTCNPPFFSQSLKCPGEQRSAARHNDCLPFEDLLKKSRSLLNENGKIAVVIPMDSFEFFNLKTQTVQYHLQRKTIVRPRPENAPKRVLLEYSRRRCIPTEDELIIELDRHIYSDPYITLTKDFYLKM